MTRKEDAARGGGPGAAGATGVALPLAASSSARNDASWFKLGAGRLLSLAHHEPDDLKLSKRVRAIALALAMQETGIDPFADELMQTTAEAMQAASEHGRKGADGRWRKPQDKMPEQCPSICPSNGIRKTERQRDRQEREREPLAAGAAALSQFSIPSWEEVKSIGAEEGYPPERVQKCFDHYRRAGWTDKQGQPIRNVRHVLSSWMNRPELAQPGATPAPIAPEDARRKEAAERRERTIREEATRIWAMQDWLNSGEACPFESDPQGVIDATRAKIEEKYGPDSMAELDKAVAEVTEEKRRKSR